MPHAQQAAAGVRRYSLICEAQSPRNLEMRKLNVGMIGYGFMGRAHSNAYAQVAHYFPVKAEVCRKVVCGRNREGVEELARTWGWEQTAMDWREVVAREDIDLVDIAAPNYLHAEIAIAAAESGKIVLCEKPLANTAEEARRMASAVERAEVANGVWFNYRRVPAVAFARELIERGALGRIFHYRAQYLQEWGNDTSRPINWTVEVSRPARAARRRSLALEWSTNLSH
jgi:predicted dehydrogenase